ncbi:MAG TPA: acyl carrier protein [Chloroflexia bacterium]|nr:acyl carrier protein [Chloroflexia bacterium]
MTRSDVEFQVHEFLMSNFIFDPAVSLGPDDSLLESDIVDSTGVLEVIMWLETTYNIKVEDSEVLPENLDSVRYMTNFILRKLDADVAIAS